MKSSKLYFAFILALFFALLATGLSRDGSIPYLWAAADEAEYGPGFLSACTDKWFSTAAGSAAIEVRHPARVTSLVRKNLIDDIYEYSAIIEVGNGPFDRIGIHRVVRERLPWLPVRTNHAVMMLHGDTSNFESSFLGGTLSANVPLTQSPAIILAMNGIDVWGMDRRVTFVTQDTVDFSFMKNWNTALHLKDTRLAVKIARTARTLTGSGWGKIVLLGHSRGAQVTYAYADMETQLPPYSRDIKAIVPMDFAYQLDPSSPDLRDAALQRYQALKEAYDAGIYYTNEGAQTKYIAQLAALYPNDPSPVITGLTNLQAAFFLLSMTWATYSPLPPPVPGYHYNAGIFDENGIPSGLQFTNTFYVMDLGSIAPSFVTVAEAMDGDALMSGLVETPYNRHLAEIRIPVMYVGAAGGFGDSGSYTQTLLGSTDKAELLVSFYPSEFRALDYGHADLLWADNAPEYVWTPIAEWIQEH